MNATSALQLFAGLLLGFALVPTLVRVMRAAVVEVEDEHVAVLTRFGRYVETIRRPGLHLRPSRVLPWVRVREVSLARDFRLFTNIHVNDARGTTVLVDLWVELRVVDPVRALFAVEDWNHAVQSLVTHAAASILGGRDFQSILHDRTELGHALVAEVAQETERWGISLDRAFVRNVSLLPEVSRHLFQTVATRIERAKAAIEERGELAVARLEAETALRCAALVAEAKAQYPIAVGRALATLRQDPAVYAAYTSLYEIAQLHPSRTVAFLGFEGQPIRAIDAAMLPGISGGLQGPAPTASGPAVADGR